MIKYNFINAEVSDIYVEAQNKYQLVEVAETKLSRQIFFE